MSGGQSRPSVLVVDGEPVVAAFLVEALTTAGFDVRAAVSAGDALTDLAGQVPDAVVLDSAGPGMSLGESLAALHRESPGCPFLVLSAGGSIDEALRAFRAGASDYCAMSIDGLDDFVRRVRMLTDRGPTELDLTGPESLEMDMLPAELGLALDVLRASLATVENRPPVPAGVA